MEAFAEAEHELEWEGSASFDVPGKVYRSTSELDWRWASASRRFLLLAPDVPLKRNKDPKVLVFTGIAWGG